MFDSSGVRYDTSVLKETTMHHLSKAVLALSLLLPLGCAASDTDRAEAFVAEMDALPAEEQVPNWSQIRGLMARSAPQVGEIAPAFTLERMDGAGTISLAEFQPTRPVVLVFGSWT